MDTQEMNTWLEEAQQAKVMLMRQEGKEDEVLAVDSMLSGIRTTDASKQGERVSYLIESTRKLFAASQIIV